MQSERLIIGSKYKSLLESSLSEFEIIWLPDNPFVDKRLSGHADLSVFNLNNSALFTIDYYKDIDFGTNTIFINEKIGSLYPDDVKLNICLVGDVIIVNREFMSETVLNYMFAASDYKYINVKQGYTKCSTLVLNSDTIITSDPGIHREAIKNNIHSLKISPGYIDLEGFDYGFIGGSGFVIDNILYLTGTIDKLPEKNEIFKLCADNNIDIKYLTNLNIFDIGGAVSVG